jgi:hypothetical protein
MKKVVRAPGRPKKAKGTKFTRVKSILETVAPKAQKRKVACPVAVALKLNKKKKPDSQVSPDEHISDSQVPPSAQYDHVPDESRYP